MKDDQRTYWNYELTPCRIVRVIVGKAERPTFWHAGLEGTEREVVEVDYHGDKFYLDNQGHDGGPGLKWPAGEGWAKVTRGRGGPDWGHSDVPVAKVLEADA